MKRVLDLSQLSVPQLLEIRSILAGGVQASADARSIARKLKAENEKLHEKNYRMGIVLSEGLDWFGHEEYWMSFNDDLCNPTTSGSIAFIKTFSSLKIHTLLVELVENSSIPSSDRTVMIFSAPFLLRINGNLSRYSIEKTPTS